MMTKSISMEVLEGVGPVVHIKHPAHEGEPEVQGHPVAGGEPDGDRGDGIEPVVGVVEHLDVPALLAESVQLVRAVNPVNHTRGGGSGGGSDSGPEDGQDLEKGKTRAVLYLLAPLYLMPPEMALRIMVPMMRKEAALPRGLGRLAEEARWALLPWS